MATASPVIDAPDAPDRAVDPGDPSERPPRRQWWDRVDGWLGLLVVLACCIYIFIQLSPKYLLSNTTATGGDTGAHVWWPAYLRDHLLPWRIAGWSPDWYAGFPAGQFYFPVPALFIVLMNVVMPYNVAFKLGTALGSLLLPVAAYVLGRGLRIPRPGPAAMAVAATAFLFWTGDPGTTEAGKSIAFNQHIMGGTLASTMAGEFSFSLALAFALFFLGTFADALHTRRRLWLPALLFALTVTSHLMVGVFAIVGGIVVWLFHHPWRNLGRTAAIGVVATLLTAVWAVPLLATLGYATDMRYSSIGECASTPCNLAGQHYVDYLFPKNLFHPQGWLPYQWGAYLLVGVLIVVAIALARRGTLTLLTLALVSGLMFRFWSSFGTKVWNLRALPFWYLSIFLLMGVALAELVWLAAWAARAYTSWREQSVARELAAVGVPETAGDAAAGDDPAPGDRTEVHDVVPPAPAAPARPSQMPAIVRAVVGGALLVALVVGALIQVNQDKGFLPYWVKWNYSGYQNVRNELRSDGTVKYALAKEYPEYKQLMDTMAKLPPGRALWEGGSSVDKYGTPLALMLLPYWTDGRIQSMEGVYFEASATTPYHFETVAALVQAANASNPERGIPYRTNADFSIGVQYLQTLGVNYFLTSEDGTKALAGADPRLELIATTPDRDGVAPKGWSIYRVKNSPLVQPLSHQPIVTTGVAPSDWEQTIGVPWFWFPGQLDKPVVADGPSSWRHAAGSAALRLPRRTLPAVHVSNVHTTDDSISFDVDRTGVPVLVKESYFPNWRADGADGPWRSTPNFMVVVPTSHHVTLHYATSKAEWLGRFLTLLGLAGLVLLFLWPSRGRRWAHAARARLDGWRARRKGAAPEPAGGGDGPSEPEFVGDPEPAPG